MKNQFLTAVWISVLFMQAIFMARVCHASEAVTRIERIHLGQPGRAQVKFSGLNAASRYELRAYTGILAPGSANSAVEILWGSHRPIQALLAGYRETYGKLNVLGEVLPCPLPDVIKAESLRRNWRTGRELMEQGLDVTQQVSGTILWITFKDITPVPTAADERSLVLDGEWRIVKDPEDKGQASGWQLPARFPAVDSEPIQVPGNVNEVFPEYHGVVWYANQFTNRLPAADNWRPILRFKASSYRSDAWLNGQFVGSHEGGEAPFEFNVAQALREGENNLIVRVYFPKGNILDGGSDGPCAYPVFWGMGGLTQGVDLVVKPLVRIRDVFARSDWTSGDVAFETTVVNTTNTPATVEISAEYGERRSGTRLGSVHKKITAPPGESVHQLDAKISPFNLWSLEDPFLYSATIQTSWREMSDTFVVPRFGFRDFRINAKGYFELNGKRLFLKSLHSNVVDPMSLEGTPRDMTWLGIDFELLKAAGFNMYRSIAYAALPEQLDLADDLGFLIYSEHQASWLMKDPAKFEMDLPGVVRRDRNHPSLVIWGMLNEVGHRWKKEETEAIYQAARSFLPKLRKIDDTRLVFLSSGRFDLDLKTGSASNPGSAAWNVYLGGEDPINPDTSYKLVDGGPYQAGAGDVHIYEGHPINREFLESMSALARKTNPVFVSEGGQASVPDPLGFERHFLKAGGASRLLKEYQPKARALEGVWNKYRLHDIYPSIEEMIVDSQRMAAAQRAIYFSAVRANPGINGYSLTSLTDIGAGEGLMDDFRHYKAGHFQAVSDGWAKLKWCLFVNPSNIYAGQSLRINVSLANEDILSPGDYPARISISGSGATVWSKDVTVRVQGGDNPPLAYGVFDEDVSVAGLKEGQYTLSATLLHRANAKADSITVNVAERDRHSDLKGQELTVLGINPGVRKLLTDSGITLLEHPGKQKGGREVILIGDAFKGAPEDWRALYERIARGAFAVFLSRETLADDKRVNKWLPLGSKGTQQGGRREPNIFRSDIVAREHPVFKGLPAGVLTPEIYGQLLRPKARFSGIGIPEDVAAVWLNLGFLGFGKIDDGLVIGVYKHQAGKFLVNSLDLTGNVGQPAADRLILNMVEYGLINTASLP